MVPQLLGKEPTHNVHWARTECYVADSNRYLSAQRTPDASAGDRGKPGEWTYSACQLACPCTEAHAYRFLGQGSCRTATNGAGTYTRIEMGSSAECRQKCNEDENCLAYEFYAHSEQCEIHTEPISKFQKQHGFRCYVKEEAVHFRMVGEGGCQTAAGLAGTYLSAPQENDATCRQKCAKDSACVAYEYYSHSKQCEIHTEKITKTSNEPGFFCYVKEEGLEEIDVDEGLKEVDDAVDAVITMEDLEYMVTKAEDHETHKVVPLMNMGTFVPNLNAPMPLSAPQANPHISPHTSSK